MRMTLEILSNAQMAKADEVTTASGKSGYNLMKAAGRSVASIAQDNFPSYKFLILAGPGNNGGDGFVVARYMQRSGADVAVACLKDVHELSGDAAKAASEYQGEVFQLTDKSVEKMITTKTVIIDSLFGTGLSKPLRAPVTDIFRKIKDCGCPVIAVDIPSGVYGDTGEVDDAALKATHTVTFFRKKIGHYLQPGRSYCGETHLIDIGIPRSAIEESGFTANENTFESWVDTYPQPVDNTYKYKKGHTVIFGGNAMTGAAHLAAQACMRVGSGLCSVLCEQGRGDVYRTCLPPHIIVREDPSWRDEKISAKAIGPGAGEGVDKIMDKFYEPSVPTVIDADALKPHLLENYNHKCFVLTPHEGEFSRMFPDITGSNLEKAQKATEITDAVIVLKGPATIIAQKDRKPYINVHSHPALATAGTGDVLTGMIAGLLAQGMTPFDAARTAVWIHGEAGHRLGVGMVASDISDVLPKIIQSIHT